jgi:hypothetical protein
VAGERHDRGQHHETQHEQPRGELSGARCVRRRHDQHPGHDEAGQPCVARPRSGTLSEGEAGDREQQDAHRHPRGRHVVTQEAVGTPVEDVEAQQVVLHDHQGGEGEAPEEHRGEDPLPARSAGEDLDAQVEEGVENQLLGVLVGADGVGREGRREQRPDRERQQGGVERGGLEPRAVGDEPGGEHQQGEREQDLGREDRNRDRRREGGGEAQLGPLQCQVGSGGVSPRPSPRRPA